MSDLLYLANKKVRRIPDVQSCTHLDVLRRFLTIHELNNKKNVFVSASSLVSEIEIDAEKLLLFPKQRYYLRNKITKLYGNFCNAKRNFKRGSSGPMKHVKEIYKKLSIPFPLTQEFKRASRKQVVKASFTNTLEEEEIQVDIDNKNQDPDWMLAEAKSKIGKFLFIDPKTCRLLDSLGISSKSMSLLFKELKRLNNIEGNTSSSYLLKRRSSEREQSMKRLQEFKFPDYLILHWDGKRMQNNSRDMVERLVISVSATNGLQKLISCNYIDDGSARSISNELKKQCDTLNITNKIVGLSYDTTAANSGVKGGAAVLFEKIIKNQLNRRPCRLHQKELCVANPFKEVVMKTVGAGIPIFSQFRKWFIHNSGLKITPAYNSKAVKRILDQNRQSLVDFYVKQTQINHRRADHREVAELALVHLNANPGYNLKACGADHHARWLSKVIYIFKIMLYKNHFYISETLLEKFEAMVLYFITVYLKYWFTCESTIYATKNDPDFLSELEKFSQMEGKYCSLIANSAKATQLRHLEYLSEDNAVFSIFDERISLEEKEQLRKKLLSSKIKDQAQKLLEIDPNCNFHNFKEYDADTVTYCTPDEEAEDFANLIHSTDQILYEKDFVDVEENENVLNKTIDGISKLPSYDSSCSKSPFDYVTLQSLKSLVNFGINISFMGHNASDWPTNKSYVNAIKIANNIKSTSIYTEQLVGRISRLSDSCLLKNKDGLNRLAIAAVDNTEIV